MVRRSVGLQDVSRVPISRKGASQRFWPCTPNTGRLAPLRLNWTGLAPLRLNWTGLAPLRFHCEYPMREPSRMIRIAIRISWPPTSLFHIRHPTVGIPQWTSQIRLTRARQTNDPTILFASYQALGHGTRVHDDCDSSFRLSLCR
jgi:hypothetical protein